MRPEQMRVYQAALQFCAEVDAILVPLPRSADDVGDHARRSCNSLLFNLAEGLVAFRPKVKAAAFDVARRESEEVRAALRRLVQRNFVSTQRTLHADTLGNSVIAMVVTMIKQQEARVV